MKKKRFYFSVTFLILAIFIIHLTSADLYNPPQPVDCSNSSIQAIWNSVFQTDSVGIKIFQNLTDSNNVFCGAFKNESTDTSFIYINQGTSSSWTYPNTTILYGNYTSITASRANLSSYWVNLLNNVSNYNDFGMWMIGLAFGGNYTLRDISTSSDANSEFTSKFKINPSTWQQYGPGEMFYFGDTPNSEVSITFDSQLPSYTNFTGDVSENVSLDSVSYFSYASYNVANQSSVSNSVNTTSNSTNNSSENNGLFSNNSQNETIFTNQLQENSSSLNSSENNGSVANASQNNSSNSTFFWILFGLIVLVIIVFCYFLFLRKKPEPQQIGYNQPAAPGNSPPSF